MKPLDLDAVDVRGEPLQLSTGAEVDALARWLGTLLPPGYQDYVTTLGWGALNEFVRVLSPAEVVAQLDEHRGRMAAFWFWDDAPDGIDQDWALSSIPIADTVDGDAVAFQPGEPGRLVILPRHTETAYVRDEGLLEAIEWICSGRVLRSFGPKRYFEPYSRQHSGTTDNSAAAEASEASPLSAADWPDERLRPTTAREHLLSFFAELRDIEEWIVRAAGLDPEIAFTGPRAPEFGDLDVEASTRERAVEARYCSPALAAAGTGQLSFTWPPTHDPSRLQIRDETSTKGKTIIRVARAEAPLLSFIHEYRLVRDGTGWRIASIKSVGIDTEWPTTLGLAPSPRKG
jgi:hypothetical protein